jgi:hypothetical protein
MEKDFAKALRPSLFQLSSSITGLVADRTLRGSITARWKYQYPNSLKLIGGKIILIVLHGSKKKGEFLCFDF